MFDGYRAAAAEAGHRVDSGQLGLRRQVYIGDDESIGGAPARVAEQIIDQCRRTGARHFLAYLFGGYSREQVRRSYDLWRQVTPILRRAHIEG